MNFKPIVCSYLTVLLSLLISISTFAQNQVKIVVDDLTSEEGVEIQEFDVKLYKEGKLIQNQHYQDGASCVNQFNCGEYYIMEFSSSNFFSKSLILDFSGLQCPEMYGGYEMQISISLMRVYDGFDATIWQVPHARIYYNKDYDSLDLDQDYIAKRAEVVREEKERIKMNMNPSTGGLETDSKSDVKWIENDADTSSSDVEVQEQDSVFWMSDIITTEGYPIINIMGMWLPDYYDRYLYDYGLFNFPEVVNSFCYGPLMISYPHLWNFYGTVIFDQSNIQLPKFIYKRNEGKDNTQIAFADLIHEFILSGMIFFQDEEFATPIDGNNIELLAGDVMLKYCHWYDNDLGKSNKELTSIGFPLKRANEKQMNYIYVGEDFRNAIADYFFVEDGIEYSFFDFARLKSAQTSGHKLRRENYTFHNPYYSKKDDLERKAYLKDCLQHSLEEQWVNNTCSSYIDSICKSDFFVPPICDSTDFSYDFLIPYYYFNLMKDNIDNYNKGRNRAKGRVRFESGGFKFKGNQKEGRPIGAWKIVSGACVLAEFEFDKNGVLNGEFVIRHANGKLAFKGVFSQNQIHGECSEFYLNGNVKAIYNFQNGKLSGLQKDFYTNGAAHSNFSIDGESGRLNGMYELYYFDGGVWCKGQFENDLKKGNWIFNIHLNSFWQGILMRYPEVETMESSVVVAEETNEEKLPQLILDRLKKGNTLGLSVFYKIEDNRSVLTSPVITN